MKKLCNYQKRSFIFIETIVSLLILSIIVSGLYKLSYNKDRNNIFQNLNIVHNNFNQNKNLAIEENKQITIVFDGIEQKHILVKQLSYKDEDFSFVRYE